LQHRIVFDDAVMDEHEVAVIGNVGMRIDIVGFTVRGPSRMAHAGSSCQRRRSDDRFKIGHLSLLLKNGQAFIEQGDAGTVVTPVFQLPQSLNQDRVGGSSLEKSLQWLFILNTSILTGTVERLIKRSSRE